MGVEFLRTPEGLSEATKWEKKRRERRGKRGKKRTQVGRDEPPVGKKIWWAKHRCLIRNLVGFLQNGVQWEPPSPQP